MRSTRGAAAPPPSSISAHAPGKSRSTALVELWSTRTSRSGFGRTPRWLVEKFVDFQIPQDMSEYPAITVEQKKKILGLNAAKLYDIPVPAELQLGAPARELVGA